MKREKEAYILGTDSVELWRLGFQHQVWSGEARRGWKIAGFNKGQKILDLGSGPGFCSTELAYICGPEGKVTAIDRSQNYITHLDRLSDLQGLNIETICADFDQMQLLDEHYDRIYCRWAMAWVGDLNPVLSKLYKALKPGGKVVFHEYYKFSTLHIEPLSPALATAIEAIKKSYAQMESNINIGKKLPGLLSENGFKVSSMREMNKLATPQDLAWNWPKTFFQIYLPKLIEMGLMTEEEKDKALVDFDSVEEIPGVQLMGPSMVEVIAEK
jgi:ubiquinone/menaquinone biosynthesis C-methylase UbiE